jgi:AcrR family transcriptional regulator
LAESPSTEGAPVPSKDGRTARSQRVRLERRAQILDAMYAVMAGRGLAGASVTEIADAADIARGALHYFFDSKAEIAAQLIKRLGDKYLGQLEEFIEERLNRKKGATLVADAARWHFKGDEGDAFRRMSVWIAYWGHATTDSALRDAVRTIQLEARDQFKFALRWNLDNKLDLSDADEEAAAAALLALVEGGLLQWRIAAGSAESLDREALGDAVANAAGAFVGALAAKRAGEAR